MEINNKKYYLSHIKVSFSMLLFAMCLTMNAFFCSAYILHELKEATVFETGTLSESIVADDDGDNTTFFETLFFNKNNSSDEIITKNLGSIFMVAAIPNGIIPIFFLMIVFLFFYLNSFKLMPDRWTLINQKVRLDD